MSLTAANFKLRFPEFNAVTDAKVDLYITESLPFVSDPPLPFSIGASQDAAQAYVIAHWLSTMPQYDANGVLLNFSGSSNTAAESSFKVGEITISEKQSSGASSSTGGTSTYFAEFNSSVYGKRYLEILKTYDPGEKAVAAEDYIGDIGFLCV